MLTETILEIQGGSTPEVYMLYCPYCGNAAASLMVNAGPSEVRHYFRPRPSQGDRRKKCYHRWVVMVTGSEGTPVLHMVEVRGGDHAEVELKRMGTLWARAPTAPSRVVVRPPTVQSSESLALAGLRRTR